MHPSWLPSSAPTIGDSPERHRSRKRAGSGSGPDSSRGAYACPRVTIEAMSTTSASSSLPGGPPPVAGAPVAAAAADEQLDKGWPYRRAYRPADRRVLGGVAAGLAEHLAVPVFWVRVGFVVLTWFGGVGVIIYAALWRFLPLREPGAETATPAPAGIAAATRSGMRTSVRPVRRPGGRERGQTFALFVLGAGVLLLQMQAGIGLPLRLTGPLAIAVLGLVLIWRQADETKRSRWVTGNDASFAGVVLHGRGLAAVARLLFGAVLLATAVGVFVAQSRSASVAVEIGLAIVLALAGALLLVGPWVYRLTTDLAAERRERIRTQERADMAAHLHDSVLQTLALLQKNASNPKTVAKLARRQERELRDWLYGADEAPDASLRPALLAVAADVEDMHDVPIDVVCVGDAPMDADVAALVRAAREAMVNSAKHSGAPRIDVYAEVAHERAEVFVRDRGVGFDPDTIEADRMGVRESIVARVERHRGAAVVRSAPGDGTEVRLSVPVGRLDPVEEDPRT